MTFGESREKSRETPLLLNSSTYAANKTSVASAAEPIAYPLVIALVVFPTASNGSVTARTFSGSPAISAMPPALSVIGP